MRARITRTLDDSAPEYANAPSGAATREPFVQRQMTKDLRLDLETQGFANIYFQSARRMPAGDGNARYQFDVIIPGDVGDFETKVNETPFRESFETTVEAVEDDAAFASEEAEAETEAEVGGESSAIAAVGNMIRS